MSEAPQWGGENGPPPKGDWILTFKDFVPESMRFWILLSFAVVFQFSGGIYLALASQMIGTRDMIRQDVMMAGYAAFIGMTMSFPILFPLKFRFSIKHILLTCSLGLAVCSVLTISTKSLFLLVPVCFFSGSLRMLGTFTCCSTIQLKITPERNMAKFFPVLWTVILGGIQLSGIVAVSMNYHFHWEYMHVVVVAALLLLASACIGCMKYHRPPFHGPREFKVDFVGCASWSVCLLLAAYVLTYGEHYDWFDSRRISGAAGCALVALLVSWYRTSYVQHPYIEVGVLGYPKILWVLTLHASMCLLMASTFVLQEAFTGGVLHYGYLDSQALNGVVFAGVCVGAILGYVLLEKAKLGYRVVTTIAFLLMLGYLVGMYRLVSPATTREAMYLPMFMRGVGNIVMYVALFTYTARTIPFYHLFHVICFCGFINMGVGSALGSAILERMFSTSLRENALALGATLDRQNLLATSIPFDALASEFHRQVMLVSIKQTYGHVAIFCVVVVIVGLMARYRGFPRFKLPNW